MIPTYPRKVSNFLKIPRNLVYIQFTRITKIPFQSKESLVSKHFEDIIDEKCRMLNKTGTSRGSALHLAQWMKGQLDDSVKKKIVENY